MSKKVDWTKTVITIYDDSDLSDMPETLPNAETVDASGCTALTALDLPNAKTVDARGCTALTALDLPNAETVYASGCTALTAWYTQKRMISFLTGGGKSIEECCGDEHWQCHSWDNCPTRAAYGVSSIGQLPGKWRSEAAIFIGLFDAGLLKNPVKS